MKRTLAGMARCALAGCLAVAAGCISTPEKRIQKEPQVFAAFPPEIQAKVRQGEVDMGFTPDMVRLALGAPSRVFTRRTAAGEAEVWIYTDIRYRTDMAPVHAGYWYRGRNGRLYRGYDTSFVDFETREEYPALRLEFTGGKVSAIERQR